MRIAIISDSHDHIWNMRKAIELIGKQEAKSIIHCGDLISPFMLKEFDPFPGSVHIVAGNNDGEQHLLTKYCLTQFPRITHHGVAGQVEMEGCRVGFAHYRLMALGLTMTSGCDLVCYGHSHTYKLENQGETLLLNPGEIMGKDGPPTFCIFDTATRHVAKMAF